MKKLFSIISAGLVLLALGSCVKEQLAVFDPEKDATAPVLGTYTVTEDGITANYTPGSFSVNEMIAPNHALALVEVDGDATSKILSSSNKDGVLSITTANLSKNLISLGYAEGSTHALKIVVRATMQDTSKDNGLNGYIDSEGAIEIAQYLIYVPEVVGSPYADYTEAATDWTVIGELSQYGISWNGDLTMWTDGGGNYVAPHVKLAAADEFKFRKDQAWTVNFGGAFGGLDTEFDVAQDGANIVVGEDGVYDLFLFTGSSKVVVSKAYDPLPDFTQESNWTVIGELSKYGISWNGDIAMVSDGTSHVALGVNLAAADEFKFRQDKAWTVNLGGEFGGIDNEFTVTQDGDNIKVGEEGTYDLFVNPAAGTAKVTAASGVKVSGIFGSNDGPDGPDTPVEVKGWNIIGLNGDWENDVLATEKDGVWTAFITAEDATEFKWRKDAGWDENYGGVMAAYNTPFAAVAGGDNIAVEAGFYKVTLDLTNADAPTITVFDDFTVWSLIGVNGDWATDIDMDEVDSKWVSPATKISGEFKIRKNHGWDDNRGGAFAELGTAFAAVAGGDNINVPEGEYIVTYDPAAETIVVDAALPSNTWSLIGVNGDWNNDVFMTELMPGVWVSPIIETTTDWKVRFNHGWDVNRGGATPSAEGVFVKAVPGGSNIGLTGKFQVVYNANNETIGTLVWGIVGSINGWGADVPMNLASDGKWYSIPVALTETDEIKIREYAGWDNNRGGACAAANEAFAVTNGGDNIKAPAAGTYMLVYDPAAETITLSTEFWGLIGGFNSWGGDKFMLFDGAKWVAYGQALEGEWKIRQAAGWDVNRGGAFGGADVAFTAVPGGDNISVSGLDSYDIVYDPAAEAIFIGDAANYVPGAAAGITIDGNFFDWADIEGLSAPDGVYMAFKATYDADYIYLYSKRTWHDGLWKDSSGGYLYYEFDTDNDPSTGTNDVNGNTGYGVEYWMYLYLYTGTAAAPTFASSPKGSAYPGSAVLENITAAGATDNSVIETEVRVPRSNLGLTSSGTIRIYSWGNKSAGNLKGAESYLSLTIE